MKTSITAIVFSISLPFTGLNQALSETKPTTSKSDIRGCLQPGNTDQNWYVSSISFNGKTFKSGINIHYGKDSNAYIDVDRQSGDLIIKPYVTLPNTKQFAPFTLGQIKNFSDNWASCKRCDTQQWGCEFELETVDLHVDVKVKKGTPYPRIEFRELWPVGIEIVHPSKMIVNLKSNDRELKIWSKTN